MQRYTFISLILLAVLLWASSAAAQMMPITANILKPQWTGLGGGYGAPGRCVARNRIVYLKTGESLVLIDISSPATPRAIDTLQPLVGPISGLRISGDTILIVVARTGFTIYSIADPKAPRLLLRQTLQGIFGMDYADGRLYYNVNAADGHGTSHIVDVHDWSAPKQLGSLSSALGYGDLRIFGDLLLIDEVYTDDAAVLIYRLTDSTLPQFVEEWFPPNDFLGQLSFRDSTGIGIGSGLGGRSLVTLHQAPSGKLGVVSSYLNDKKIVPVACALSGSSVLVAASQVTGFPSLYASVLLRGTLLEDGTILFTDTLALSIYRGETLAASSLVAADSAFFLSTEYSIVTGATGADGRVAPVGGFTLPGLVLDVAMRGRTVYALTNKELVTLDFTHPATPDTLSRMPLVAERLVMADSSRLVAADSVLRLIDVADPRAPRVVGSHSLGRNRIATRIAASSSVAAAVMPGSSVEILRISGDSLLAAASLPLRASSVALRGDTLYVATLDSSLVLWDISQPAAPRRLAATIVGDKALIDVSLSGDTLIASSDWTANYYRISELPLASSFGRTNGNLHARFLGRYLFYCQLDDDFEVADFESEFGGRIVGEVGTVSDPNFALQDSLLVVAAQYLGLRVYTVDTSLATVSVEMQEHAEGVAITCIPNPACHATIVRYFMPEHAHARITVEDPMGRTVAVLADYVESPGEHTVPFDAELPSGRYFVVLRTPRRVAVSPMVVVH